MRLYFKMINQQEKERWSLSRHLKETNEEENIQEEAEDELALISKKIQRMMRRRDQIKKYFPNRKDNTKGEVDKS
jgi:hypothetical protein